MKNQKLFVKLGLIISAVVVVLYIAQIVFISFFTRSKLFEDSKAQYSEMAKLCATNISDELEKYKCSLDFYVNADVCKTKDPASIVAWLQSRVDARSTDFDYVSFVDKAGNFTSDIKTNTKVSDRDYFQAIMNKGANDYIDNPVISKTSGKNVIHICKAVKVDRQNIGFFVANSSPDRVNKIVEGIDLNGKGAAVLISGTDALIATSGDKDEISAILKDNESRKILSSINGTGYAELKSKGLSKKYHVFYNPISGTQWKNLIILGDDELLEISKEVVFLLIVVNIIIGVVIIVSSSVLIARATKPLTIVEKSISEIATGHADLTKRINIKKDNTEIGRVVESFNTFSSKLQEIISVIKNLKDDLVQTEGDLKASTEDTVSAITQINNNINNFDKMMISNSSSVTETAGAVNQISSNIESLNDMIEGQSASVTEASAAVEEMIGNISSVNTSVGKMANSFEDLSKQSAEGMQKQSVVNSKILTIANESETLQEANAVISSIAEQTNLLAMNAAIEAAHAGEAGKGFSVVADEIRKLSETSSEQSRTIGEQLQKIVNGIEEIVGVSKDASETFATVAAGMNDTTNLVLQIKNAMDEQGEGSRQISLSLSSMNDSTVQVRNASEEMAAGNKAILEEVQRLQDSSLDMKSSMDEMTAGARKIDETGKALSDISKIMSEAIQKIGNEVNLFTV